MNAQPQFITNADGEKISVILPLEDYQELIEDLEDLAVIAERKDEATKPFEVALREIGTFALLGLPITHKKELDKSSPLLHASKHEYTKRN